MENAAGAEEKIQWEESKTGETKRKQEKTED
jgi:hypothetical protein